jgi:hypothetical protein
LQSVNNLNNELTTCLERLGELEGTITRSHTAIKDNIKRKISEITQLVNQQLKFKAKDEAEPIGKISKAQNERLDLSEKLGALHGADAFFDCQEHSILSFQSRATNLATRLEKARWNLQMGRAIRDWEGFVTKFRETVGYINGWVELTKMTGMDELRLRE